MGGTSPYIGMVIIVPYNFAPAGWAFCQGQLMPISENEALFQLLGTTYGGDGQSTFGLPNLQSRVCIGAGQGPGLGNYTLGQTGGVESVTLTTQQIPAHTHPAVGSSNSQNSTIPNNNFLATGPTTYTNDNAPDSTMAPGSVSVQGGSQPHSNIKPFLTLNYVISLFGIFPSQN